MLEAVYVFQGGRLCSGVFSTKEKAEEWIKKYALTGMLTVYPIDESAYDWAIRMGYFKVKKEKESTPEFIGGFSSGSQEHFHYKNGELIAHE
ncbi:hypothetical protein FAM09_11950 [Niastella caeni]|uniref:DUF7710 domain-containing protein n=1 Tax=Niastella caeni TaxID=2569763 RepID=A0A4S8HVK5_9BACT|nr:hypothetical protein [Niastella caeni]THU39221.1 hypothetical protein FAM09_11950 [Niastella caeni]